MPIPSPEHPPRARRRLGVAGAALAVACAMVAAPASGAAAPAPDTSGTNPAPRVLPSLRQWHGGTGDWHLTGGTRVVLPAGQAGSLRSTAATFVDDLASEAGWRPDVVTGAPRPGDISLSAAGSDAGLGSEGYRLNIGDVLAVTAPSVTGVFYGTQTIEQILKADPHRSRVPRGSARDWPRTGERAQMLDVGRKYYPMSYLKSQIRRMAWHKMNTFHLHFTDWEGFRIQTTRYPGLAAKQSYSAADIRELQDYAHKYHVMIIPEVDLPAHATAITKYDPSLRFSCHSLDYSNWAGGSEGGWVLNITSAHTRTFVHNLLAEIIPMFDAPYFHIGGDEYPYDDAKAKCPELVRYQHERGFAYPGDVFTDFFNTLNDQVRSYGKTTEMWEWWDFNNQKVSILPDKNIVIDSWVNNDPVGLAEQGYKVVGTPEQTLYVSAGFGNKLGDYGYVDIQKVYERYAFSTDPNVLGYKISRWSDNAEQQSPQWFDFFAKRPLQVLADRLWGGPREPSVWQFLARADAIGDPPASQLTGIVKAGAHVVDVDSQETSAEDGRASNVLDDDPYTIWHTAYTPSAAPLPHHVTVDYGRQYRMAGFRYLPRQDGGVNGRVGDYRLEVSNDGVSWRQVAAGTFVDDQTAKEVDFAPTTARYARFTATSEVHGRPYTSMAELTMLQAPTPDVAAR